MVMIIYVRQSNDAHQIFVISLLCRTYILMTNKGSTILINIKTDFDSDYALKKIMSEREVVIGFTNIPIRSQHPSIIETGL